MPKRFNHGLHSETTRLKPFLALRATFKEGYSKKLFRADLEAGLIVGLVATPLAMALAIATGVAPQFGLYTAIIAGFLTALLGGSMTQVTGPTAAFVVVLVPIVHDYGLSGLLVAGFLAGVILILMGVLRLGRLIEYIPETIILGFTAGIAVVIAFIQLKDIFGLNFTSTPEGFFERLQILWQSSSTFSMTETLISLATLLILFAWPRFSKKIPAPLAAITFITVFATIFQKFVPNFSYATIENRFSGGIPRLPPTFAPLEFSWPLIQALLPSAFTIALLGAIESLLSAVVADGMAKTKHDPDSELVALGTSNIICPFFGGIAATGAIARTATNIRYGAQSPIAAMIHSIFILLAILLFAPVIGYLPMASLAALLLFVAYHMADIKNLRQCIRKSSKYDLSILLTCFSMTVIFNMVVGVAAGLVLTSLKFWKSKF